MLWMIVILLIGSLSFVIFHKPHVKAMGAGWVPPAKRQLPPPPSTPSVEAGESEQPGEAPVAPAPQMPDTFNFNDLFSGSKNQGPTDRPQA